MPIKLISMQLVDETTPYANSLCLIKGWNSTYNCQFIVEYVWFLVLSFNIHIHTPRPILSALLHLPRDHKNWGKCSYPFVAVISKLQLKYLTQTWSANSEDSKSVKKINFDPAVHEP